MRLCITNEHCIFVELGGKQEDNPLDVMWTFSPMDTSNRRGTAYVPVFVWLFLPLLEHNSIILLEKVVYGTHPGGFWKDIKI